MERFGRGIVRLRIPILLITCAAVSGAGSLLPRLTIDVSSKNLLFVDEHVRKSYNRYLTQWGSDRWLIIGVRFTSGDAFTTERLAFVRKLGDRLARLEGVKRVESVTNTAAMSAEGDELFFGPLVPESIPTDAVALGQIRRRILASPLLNRALINDDGTMVAINLRIRDPGKDERKILELARQVRQIRLTAERPRDTELYEMGGPAMLATMYDIVRRDLWVLGVAPIVLVGLILLLVFRSVRGALLPLATVLSTGAITFGGMVASGHQVNLVTTMLPCLMMVIGVADVIHVLVQHRETLADGLDGRAAAVETVRRVGLPVLLTSVTTAVGFGSLVLSDVPQVREFGIFAAVGVMVAMVLSLVSVPAFLSLLPTPPPQKVKRLTHGATARGLQRLFVLTQRSRWLVIAVSLALAVFGGLGLLRLEAESSTREYLPKNHPIRHQFDMVERNLMGGVPVILHVQDRRPQTASAPRPTATPRPAMAGGDDEVIDDPEDDPSAKRSPARPRPAVATPRHVPAVVAPSPSITRRERLRDPVVLAVLEELTQQLAKLGWVRKVISITEYIKEVNRVMHGGHLRHYRLPKDRRVIAAYLEMAGGRDREGMERLVNWEYSRANITIMCAWPNTRKIRTVLQAVRRFLARPDVKRRLGKDVTVEVTGMVPMLSNVADRMVAGQIKSFFAALAVICVMMVLVLWSFRVGLLAMIPNVLPILLTMGLMGWLDITLNVTTVNCKYEIL